MPRWRSWEEWWCNKEDWQRLGSVPKDQLGAQKIRDCSEKQHTHHHHHPPSYINMISCLVTHNHTSIIIVETLSSSLKLTGWTIFITYPRFSIWKRALIITTTLLLICIKCTKCFEVYCECLFFRAEKNLAGRINFVIISKSLVSSALCFILSVDYL